MIFVLHPLARESNDGPPGGRGPRERARGGARGHLWPAGSGQTLYCTRPPDLEAPRGHPLPWSSPPARAQECQRAARGLAQTSHSKFAGQQGRAVSWEGLTARPHPRTLCAHDAPLSPTPGPAQGHGRGRSPRKAGPGLATGGPAAQRAHAPQHVAQVLGHPSHARSNITMAAYKRDGPEAVVLLRAGPSPRCRGPDVHAELGWGRRGPIGSPKPCLP